MAKSNESNIKMTFNRKAVIPMRVNTRNSRLIHCKYDYEQNSNMQTHLNILNIHAIIMHAKFILLLAVSGEEKTSDIQDILIVTLYLLIFDQK